MKCFSGRDGHSPVTRWSILHMAAAVDWVRDAFGHLKAIGCVPEAQPLLDKASIVADTELGLVTLESKPDFDALVETAKKHRSWHRERLVRSPR